MYLTEIGQHPLLTKEEETELSKQIQTGLIAGKAIEQYSLDKLSIQDTMEAKEFVQEISEQDPEIVKESPYIDYLRAAGNAREYKRQASAGADAKDRFIKSNLRLVVSIARRYPLPQGMDLLDLIQEGNLGLEHAVEKFEWQRGFKFSTYSTFWIRQAIGRALDQKASLIRLPGDKSASLRGAVKAAKIEEGGSLSAKDSELHKLANPVSLNSTTSDGDAELGDFMASQDIGPEDQFMEVVQSELLNELLGTLDARARYAVEARFGLIDGERKSFREVGEYLGVTAEAVRRLVSRAVAGLRDDAERILDPDYSGQTG